MPVFPGCSACRVLGHSLREQQGARREKDCSGLRTPRQSRGSCRVSDAHSPHRESAGPAAPKMAQAGGFQPMVVWSYCHCCPWIEREQAGVTESQAMMKASPNHELIPPFPCSLVAEDSEPAVCTWARWGPLQVRGTAATAAGAAHLLCCGWALCSSGGCGSRGSILTAVAWRDRPWWLPFAGGMSSVHIPPGAFRAHSGLFQPLEVLGLAPIP